MSLPASLLRRLHEASPDPQRQRVVLALLLQAPYAVRGPGRHRRPKPPLQGGDNPALCSAKRNSGKKKG